MTLSSLENNEVGEGMGWIKRVRKWNFKCNCQVRPYCQAVFKQDHEEAGFRKGRGNRDQIANIYWIIEKAREFQKNIYFCFIDYANAFDCVDHNKLWKILKELGIPDHLTCLLRKQQLELDMEQQTGSK